MLEGLALLFGIVQAAGGEAWWERPRGAGRPVSAYSVSADPAADDAFRAYHSGDGPGSDPIHQAIGNLPGRLITRTRRQLVSDASWYRSATFDEYFRRGGIDHELV